MYNVKDYVRIGTKKGQLLQCFAHIYRRKRYAFLVVYTLIELRKGDLEDEEDTDEPVLNTTLNLSVHRWQTNQYVYGLSALHHDTLYLIDVLNESDWSNESYVLECIWGVAYLWKAVIRYVGRCIAREYDDDRSTESTVKIPAEGYLEYW